MAAPGIVLTWALMVHPSTAAPPPTPAVEVFRRRHRRTQQRGMSVLTGFAVANIGVGLAGALTDRGVPRYVHEMNAAWNTVNLSLGIVGLVTNRKLPRVHDASGAIALHRRTIRTYAINGGLDVVYIAAGTALYGLGLPRSSPGWDRVEGYGISIMLQGGFLFAFDLALLIAHRQAARSLPERAPSLAVVPSRDGVTMGLGGRF